MAYSNEYFLIALGFKKKDDPAPFCALGQTYSVNNSIMYGVITGFMTPKIFPLISMIFICDKTIFLWEKRLY